MEMNPQLERLIRRAGSGYKLAQELGCKKQSLYARLKKGYLSLELARAAREAYGISETQAWRLCQPPTNGRG